MNDHVVDQHADGEEAYERYARARVAELAADEEAFALSYNLLHLSYALITDFESKIHRPRGWTLPGFRLMFKLWLLGPMQPAKLAELSATTRSAMSNLINTLEGAGFVERRRDEDDRRVVFVGLTERGRTSMAEAFPRQNAREQEWFAVLDHDERAALVGLVRRLINHHPPTAD